MLKVTGHKKNDIEMTFEIEDETEDFDELGMELSTLVRYAYDCLRTSAEEGGASDPEREARLYIDTIVNNAINGDIQESSPSDERRAMLHLVDDYLDKKDQNDKKKD
ncbi:MAG: hypothetical protein ACOX41_03415 [Anaerovoracaceae bacterium]|jgi:hypothetical protein